MDRHFFFVYYRLLAASWKTFGLKQFVIGLFALPLTAFSNFLLALDRVFFPGYRKVEIVKPIFIIGHQRSGTTFFHRLINQTDEFACFRNWQLFLPSLTGRALFTWPARPLRALAVRARYRQGKIYADESHKITYDSIEEDELLFVHWADTAYFNKSALAFDDRDNQEILRYDEQPAAHRRLSIKRFRACLQRQLYWTGKRQIVAKMPFSTMRIKTLLEEFPDAKFVYLVRSPFDTIASHLSQDRSYFDSRWGLDKIPESKLRRYFERRYQANAEIYRYFHQLKKSGALPPDCYWVLKYDRLRTELHKCFEEFVAFTGIAVSEELRQKVREQAARQKDYKAGHKKLELEAFGLSRERILADLGFVFEEYGFDRGEVPQSVTGSA